MRRFIPFLLLLSLFFVRPVGAQSGAEIQVDNLEVSYRFGGPVTFQARLLDLPGQVKQAHIVFRAEGEAATRVLPVTIQDDGLTVFTYAAEQGALRPFALVRYSYNLTLEDGRELHTSEFSFFYTDNRFQWAEREVDGVRVHWYAGGEPFGQAALDAARLGLKRTRDLLQVTPSAPIDIYVYASVVDLQQAFEMGGITWAGGHASPDLRIALAVIAPGPEQGLEMERKIPHELAHILTYDLTRERYPKLPVWLREGIASRVELSVTPDYGRAVTLAYENGSLIPFNELCGSFPPDSGRAFLAYAQSEAFTRYFIEQYGQTGLLALIKAYGDGLDCEQGARQATGKPLSQLEADWLDAALGKRLGLADLGTFTPYLVLLTLILVVPLTNAFLRRRIQNG